jgi:hypothetical protein
MIPRLQISSEGRYVLRMRALGEKNLKFFEFSFLISSNWIRGSRGAAGSREQGEGSREQGAGSREQGAGSREQGAGSREQGAESREQGAGSREQEAGNREGAGSKE